MQQSVIRGCVRLIGYYTDKDICADIQRAARWMGEQHEAPANWEAIMPLIVALDAAIKTIPTSLGIYWRDMDIKAMPHALQERWRDATRLNRVTEHSAYTSVSKIEGSQYAGDLQMRL